MVENWDGPPTGYDWKQFLASVKLVRLTKLDSRPWGSTKTDWTHVITAGRALLVQVIGKEATAISLTAADCFSQHPASSSDPCVSQIGILIQYPFEYLDSTPEIRR